MIYYIKQANEWMLICLIEGRKTALPPSLSLFFFRGGRTSPPPPSGSADTADHVMSGEYRSVCYRRCMCTCNMKLQNVLNIWGRLFNRGLPHEPIVKTMNLYWSMKELLNLPFRSTCVQSLFFMWGSCCSFFLCSVIVQLFIINYLPSFLPLRWIVSLSSDYCSTTFGIFKFSYIMYIYSN
jgi:hypothetical protein